MKLLLINYEFPPLGGGAGNATKNIAKELASLNNEVVVLTSSFNNLPTREETDGYKIIRLKSKRKRLEGSNPWEMLCFIWQAFKTRKKIIEEFLPEKIIAFFAIPSGVIAYWFKKKHKIKYILSLRGGDVPGFLPKQLKIYHWLTKFLIKKIWQEADQLVANSNYLKGIALRSAGKLKHEVKVIYNGVDLAMFKPAAGKTPKNLFKILFVGRLSKEKNVELLLRALKGIIESGRGGNLVLEIVGSGPEYGKLLKLANDLAIKEKVIFTPWCGKENLVKIYQSADLFVLPSIDEAMPNVILEAMACGLPIIATSVGGIKELINHGVNCFLFEQNDLESLMQYILWLANDQELLNKFCRASLEKSQEFNWPEIAKQYLAVLNN